MEHCLKRRVQGDKQLQEEHQIGKQYGDMDRVLSCYRCRQIFSASAFSGIADCPYCGTRNVNPTAMIVSCWSPQQPNIMWPVPKLTDPSWSGRPPTKRAVLCGVSYYMEQTSLKGTVNDVMIMKDLLIQMYGFQEHNIIELTEERFEGRLIPTKANIEYWLKWLVRGCRPRDSLVFYYAGHGTQVKEVDYGDELDGYDEAICPVDHLEEGLILDNDIYATIVEPLPEGVTLHAIVDACCSGTILDLENVYNIHDERWYNNIPPSGKRKRTSGGKAYSISACRDEETSAETPLHGAFTFLLNLVLRRGNGNITYGELFDEIEKRILVANRKGYLAGFAGMRIESPLTQNQMLSASEIFPVYRQIFTL